MSELKLTLILFILLVLIVGIRFLVLLYRLSKQSEYERNWYDEEWLNEKCIRHSKHYED